MIISFVLEITYVFANNFLIFGNSNFTRDIRFLINTILTNSKQCNNILIIKYI